jgi:cytochrome P450 / NADPH-cytochrome P450 reductase
MKLAREYGPIYRLAVPGGPPRYVVSGADLVEEVCDEKRFDKLVSGGLSAVRRDPVNTGLFTADTGNPLWRRAHNILLPNFSQQAMRDYHPMMLDVAVQLMLKWQRLNPGDEADVAADMTRLTLDTIALCGFGYRFNSFYRRSPHPFVAAMVRTLEESQTRARSTNIQTRLRFRAARQLTADQAFMDRLVDEIIRERKKNPDGRRDLLGCMLEGVDKQSGERLPDANIRAQCITFLVAGHETTRAPRCSCSPRCCTAIPRSGDPTPRSSTLTTSPRSAWRRCRRTPTSRSAPASGRASAASSRCRRPRWSSACCCSVSTSSTTAGTT